MIRRTPIRKRRTKPRPGRLNGEDMTQLREACYARDKGICQMCGEGTYKSVYAFWKRRYHMAHILGRGAGGKDELANVRVLCGSCHLEQEHNAGGKPCPPKPRAEVA